MHQTTVNSEHDDQNEFMNIAYSYEMQITKQIMIYHKFIHLHVQALTRLKPQGKIKK